MCRPGPNLSYTESETSSGYVRPCFRKQIKYTENETMDGGYCAGEHMGREGGGTEPSWPRQEVTQNLKELATSVSPDGKERGWQAPSAEDKEQEIITLLPATGRWPCMDQHLLF